MIILAIIGTAIFGGALMLLLLPELIGILLPSVMAVIAYWCVYRVIKKGIKWFKNKTE